LRIPEQNRELEDKIGNRMKALMVVKTKSTLLDGDSLWYKHYLTLLKMAQRRWMESLPSITSPPCFILIMLQSDYFTL